MANIGDIAKATGLGYSTVAQIMQGRSNYRPETITRVREAAEQLGYRPDYLGKSLAGGRSMSVGIYLESTVTIVSTQILYPIEAESRKAGYMTYITSGLREDRVMSQIDKLMQRRIDGLIYHSTTPQNQELQDFLRKLSIPVVFIDRPVIEHHPATVAIDYSQALEELAASLAASGYRRAQLLYNTFFLDYPERLQYPYKSALDKHSIQLDVSPEWCCEWNPESEVSAYKNTAANLAAGNIPKLLLCFNDQAALGAIAAVRDAGLKIPEDVGVVGRDGLLMLKYMRPSLSSLVRPDGRLIAGTAFDMLLQMMNTPAFQPSPARLHVRFEPGDTILHNL